MYRDYYGELDIRDDRVYNSHHYYGHVGDASKVDLRYWMFVVPAIIFLASVALASGLWFLLLVIWLLK